MGASMTTRTEYIAVAPGVSVKGSARINAADIMTCKTFRLIKPGDPRTGGYGTCDLAHRAMTRYAVAVRCRVGNAATAFCRVAGMAIITGCSP